MVRYPLVFAILTLFSASALAQQTEIVSPPPAVTMPAIRLTGVSCHLRDIRALTVTGTAQNISGHKLTGVGVKSMIGLDDESIIWDSSLYPQLRLGDLEPGQSVRFKIVTAGPSSDDPDSASAKNYFKGCDTWAIDQHGLDISYHVRHLR